MPDYPLSRDALMARMAGPRAASWLDVRNVADGKATIRLHDVIGDYWAMTTSADVAATIDAIDADEITVSINSPGGNIFDGVAIYNALRAHPARIVTRVDGLAASIASVIAQAGDERQMMGGSQMMIHNAWGVAIGDAPDMRKMAEVLDHQNLVIAEIYAQHSATDAAELLDLMAAETWYTASTAVDSGLADVVVGASAPTSSDVADAATDGASNSFDPSLSLALLDL